MAEVIGNNQIKLNSGQIVAAQQGAWFDGRQFWGGTLSQPGQINSLSNQQGAGQQVSSEVVNQTNPANSSYIQQQQQIQNVTPTQPASPTPSSATPTGGGTGAGLDIGTPATINLPQLYESLYSSSGIRDLEANLSAKTDAYNAQVAKIKDNPYLSEATMTGRLSKLEEKFNADNANTKNDIAMRKADIETQLNLQTKQFDIESQAAKDALDRFNILLSNGSLANASGEDIANLTRATGLSSQAIQSAINAAKAKSVNTQVITSTADNGEVTAVVINQNTGEIISKTSLGNIGNAQGGSSSATKADETAQNTQNLITDIKKKITLKSLVQYWSGVLPIDQIYSLYNQYSPWGQATETLAQVKQGKFAY